MASRSKVVVGVLVLLGIAAGGLGRYLVAAYFSPKDVVGKHAPEPISRRSGNDIENGLSELPLARSRAEVPQEPIVAGSNPAVMETGQSNEREATPEQRREATLASHQRLVDMHEAEPVDEKWASEKKYEVEKGLAALAREGGGYRIKNVDCRSTSCSAELEWPNFEAAATNASVLAHTALYGPDCARRIILPEPEDRTRPYAASLLVWSCRREDAQHAQR
jgi:hypothetical protein